MELNKKKIGAVYCRVSTEKESQASSMDNQREFFEKLFEREDIILYKIYADEGISGTKLKQRKQFNALIKDAKAKKFDRIYVKDVSRFSRNTLDFLNVYRDLKSHGARMFFVTNSFDSEEASEFMITMIAAMAQEESAKVSERIKFAKNLSAEKGRVPNFVYGYDRVDRYTLQINSQERKVVETIFDLYINQGLGQLKIAQELNSLGVKTKKENKNWQSSVVGQLLKNQIYIGKIINHKSYIKDFLTSKRHINNEQDWVIKDVPEYRIISEEIFEKAQQELNNRGKIFKSNTTTRYSNKYSFSTLIKCAECGMSFRRMSRKYSVQGEERVWWECTTRNGNGVDACTNSLKIKEKDLMTAIIEQLSFNNKDKERLIQKVRIILKQQVDEYNNTIDEALQDDPKEELKKFEKLRKKKIELYEGDVISLEELKNDIKLVDNRINSIKDLLQGKNKSEKIIADLNAVISKFFENFDLLDKSELMDNSIIKSFISKIEANKNGTLIAFLKLPLPDYTILDFPVSLTIPNCNIRT
jgi:site-specific DNA recombinase